MPARFALSPANAFFTAAAILASTPCLSGTIFDSNESADFLINMSFFQGGDKIASHVGAGDGFALGIGGAFALGDSSFNFQTSINYFNDEVGVSEGNRFERYPLEALFFFSHDGHRFGAGISYHLDPNYGGNDGEREIGFDNATGLVIEYQYVINGRFAVGVRHVDIDYDSDEIEESIDGSHNGITFTLFI